MQQEAKPVAPETVAVEQVTLRQSAVKRLRQDAVAVGASLIVFLVVMLALVQALFPDGTRLGEGEQFVRDRAETKSNRNLNYAERGVNSDNAIASIEAVRRQVRFRSSDSLLWAAARNGSNLADRDAVQTLSGAGAVIRFNEGTELNVGEQSLVVLQQSRPDPFVPKRRSTVVMVSGQLTGRVSAAGDDDVELEIEMPNGMVVLRGDADGGGGAEFRLDINPDATSSVSLTSGSARIHAAGEVVTLTENQGLVITPDGKSVSLVELPRQPALSQPRAGFVARYSDLPPTVGFRWDAGAAGQEYRFLLGTDAGMRQLVVDQRLTHGSFDYGNLEPGRYFWTVQAVAGWNEGPRAPVRELAVERDITPPDLHIDKALSVVFDSRLRVSGRTEPGSKVYVQGEPVIGGATGKFEHHVSVPPGTSIVLIEAVDDVGNVAYASHTVTAKVSRH